MSMISVAARRLAGHSRPAVRSWGISHAAVRRWNSSSASSGSSSSSSATPTAEPAVSAEGARSAGAEASSTGAASASLLAQIYPLDKAAITESDVDQWLAAVQKLKRGNTENATTAEEVYLQQLTAEPQRYLSETFEPTAEQQADADALSGTAMPLANHPVVENFVCLMMKDGKKSKYQKILNRALYIIYLKKRQDPVELLGATLDKLGPLMATRTEKTGTAKNRMVPYPLNQRQRNRYAIRWILDGASKKKSPDYSVRLAEEIMSAHDGKSSGYEKKTQMHRNAIQQRAFIKL